MSYDVVIKSTGRYLPQRVFTNHEFEALIDTSDEWITERTGIKERRFAAPGESNSDMALHAVQDCLRKVEVDPESVDLIIVPTVTPDTVFPATANWLQGKLGNTRAWSFDLNAGCGGFVYGLSVATGLLRSGTSKRCLLVGSEKMTSLLDFTDRSTCVLFGDGAACVLLDAVEQSANPQRYGIGESVLGSDGRFGDILYQPAGGSNKPPSHLTVQPHDHFVHMQGREVYKHAVRRMEQIILELLENAQLKPEDIRWFIPHQANARIIESIQERLGMPRERFYINIDRYGNTTSATIPLCLDELNEQEWLNPGDRLLLFTFGTGLTWGSTLVTWGTP